MRDDDLPRIRPSIPSAGQAEKAIEAFQSGTLRPILKLQNPLLLALMRQYLAQRKLLFFKLPTAERRGYLAHAVGKDLRFRELLFGCVLGHFTLEEYAFFMAHEAECRRRLGALLVERFHSQMDALAEAAT